VHILGGGRAHIRMGGPIGKEEGCVRWVKAHTKCRPHTMGEGVHSHQRGEKWLDGGTYMYALKIGGAYKRHMLFLEGYIHDLPSSFEAAKSSLHMINCLAPVHCFAWEWWSLRTWPYRLRSGSFY
jgi:hypothetical protein